MDNILLGIGLILLGMFSIWRTRNHPIEGRDIWLIGPKGYIYGFLGILCGLLMILNTLLHKH